MTRKLTAKPISIASDHRGFALKERLKTWLQANDYAVEDCGAQSGAERVDAMDYALALVADIGEGRADFAIGICGSGQMMAMTVQYVAKTLPQLPNFLATRVTVRYDDKQRRAVLGREFRLVDAAGY